MEFLAKFKEWFGSRSRTGGTIGNFGGYQHTLIKPNIA